MIIYWFELPRKIRIFCLQPIVNFDGNCYLILTSTLVFQIISMNYCFATKNIVFFSTRPKLSRK